MNPCYPRGDQNSQIVCLGYQPSEQDQEKGTVFMDTAGWFLDKLMNEAGLPVPFYMTVQPVHGVKLPEDMVKQSLLQILDMQKYPLIITCDLRYVKNVKNPDSLKGRGASPYSDVLRMLCPDTNGELSKYAGSLLISPFINWPHYIIPTFSPQYIFENYAEKDVVVSIDLGKVREELAYFRSNGKLQQLPERELHTEPPFSFLMDFLVSLHSANYLSNDIETIRPPKGSNNKDSKSPFKGHPGYPYTLSLAPSSKLGISFSLWDYDLDQLIQLWRELDWLMRNIPQIGQNYFLFDINFLQALGFRPCIERCQDTLIRHHILWPELAHSLQFQTRQYTRQPYYKDEGKNWKPSQKRQLMRYNALDTTVTYEIFEQQEIEFNERPHLR